MDFLSIMPDSRPIPVPVAQAHAHRFLLEAYALEDYLLQALLHNALKQTLGIVLLAKDETGLPRST